MSEQVAYLPLPDQGSWPLIRGCIGRTLAAMASGVLVGFVMGFVAAITHYISPRQVTTREIAFFQLLIILSILAASATYLFFARNELKERLQKFLPDLADGLRRPTSLLILLCIPLGVVGTIHWAMTTPQMTKTFLHDTPPIYWLAIAIPVIIVGPAAEEVFYRGFVWDRLSGVMPPWKAAIISAALFLGSHICNGLLAPLFVLPLTIILTVLRLRRMGVGMCLLAHSVYNGTIILGNFVQTYFVPLYVPS